MPDADSPLLTPAQKRIVATAITFSAGIFIISLLVFIVYILNELIRLFSGVLWPLVIASILTLLLQPLVSFLEHKLKIGRTAALILLFALVFILCLSILALILPILITQTIDFVQNFPNIVTRIREFFLARFPDLFALLQNRLSEEALTELTKQWEEQAKNLVNVLLSVLRKTGSGLSTLFGWFAGLALIPIYLFYLLSLDRDLITDLSNQLVFLRDEVRDDIVFLLREFTNIVATFFRGQLLIGLITGAMLATGFTFIGLNFGIVLGLGLGLLNLIPYLGTILGLGTALPLAYFQEEGGLVTVGLTLLVFVLAQAVESYLVAPRILGKSTGLHPMVVIIALFFWYTALNGILGMILGIPLTAFLITAWRLVRRKYLSPVRESITDKAWSTSSLAQ